jgi:release factor glutamine methyltransferase
MLDTATGNTVHALETKLPFDALENRILLCHALGISRVGLITQSERVLTDEEGDTLDGLVERRMLGEPIAYIVGKREFYGLDFRVTAAVLIPRPDTELLVEKALEKLPARGRVLDMGTGSGAIAVSIAHTRRDAMVSALDVSTAALDIARDNAITHSVPVRFMQSDWFGALHGEEFDVIVSNPPYIADGDVHLSQGDLLFEPSGALTDGADGLSCLRKITSGAARHLHAGGWLLMEHGYDQAAQVRAMLEEAGYQDVASWTDLAGIERVTGGRKK